MTMLFDRLRSLRVADIMSRQVVPLSLQQPMAEVAGTLVDQQISAAPVVNRDGICVGILSATDFLKREAAYRSPTPTNAGPLQPHVWKPEDVVATYMSSGVQTIEDSATLQQAATIMCAQHVHRLPVVNASGTLIGMVSSIDLVAAMNNAIQESLDS